MTYLEMHSGILLLLDYRQREKLRQGLHQLVEVAAARTLTHPALSSNPVADSPGEARAMEAAQPKEPLWWVPQREGKILSVWTPVPKESLLQYDAGSVYSAVDAEELCSLLQPMQADPDVTWVEVIDGAYRSHTGRADAPDLRVIQYHIPKVDHATLDHLLRFPKGVISLAKLADHEQLPGWVEHDVHIGVGHNYRYACLYKQERLRRKLTEQELAAREATRQMNRLLAGEVSEAALTVLWRCLMVERRTWVHHKEPWKHLGLHWGGSSHRGRAPLMLFIPAVTQIIHLMRRTPYRTNVWRKQILELAPAVPGLLRYKSRSKYKEQADYQTLAFRAFGRWLREEVRACKAR